MSETPQQQLAIEALVRGRCHELGLRPVELVRRCGYQNVSKGLRRLEQLRAGDFARTVGLVRALPTALEVPVDVVREAVEKTERYLHEFAEAAWRAAFRPHAIDRAIRFDLEGNPAELFDKAYRLGTVSWRLGGRGRQHQCAFAREGHTHAFQSADDPIAT